MVNVFVGSICLAVFSFFFVFFLGAIDFILLRICPPWAELRVYRWQFKGQILSYKRQRN